MYAYNNNHLKFGSYQIAFQIVQKKKNYTQWQRI